MIYLLDKIKSMSDFCNSIVLYNALVIIRRALSIIQIIGPIVAIISLAISLVLLTTNPEEKKYIKRIKNSLIATLILFFIPAIINFIMALPSIQDNTTLGSCWEMVDAKKNSK